MRQATFIVFLLVLWLATCSAPGQNFIAPVDTATTVPTNIPPTETAVPLDTLGTTPPTPTEVAAAVGKLPAPSFPTKLYVSKSGGFALDYPDGWTVSETVVGPRGTQILFVSKPELAEAAVMPEGETRVGATIYQWDPKNDLAAYVEHWKSAWQNSGFTILEEKPLTLELGLPAVEFTVQTPEVTTVFLVIALQDQYLVLSAEGDLELAKQIMERVRLVSP